MVIRLVVLSVIAALLGTAAPAQAGTSGSAADSHRSARAIATLAEARALFDHGSTRARRAVTAHRDGGRDATMVLRDLRFALPDLSAADRRTARAILARPDAAGTPIDGEHTYTAPEETPLCDQHVCVHYVLTSDDAATPEQAQLTLDTFSTVWAKEITGLGYRAPLDDSALTDNGGGAQLDVYLQNIASADNVLYGYCAPDTAVRQTSGYCVLDNDYDPVVFTHHMPTQNLQVTAAHEFFHAVQFGYDAAEATWFMEGTAAWMEDEVFDAVNDNLQYLVQSPLRYPYLPVDFTVDTDTDYYSPYGNWIFWRFLSESAKAGLNAQDPSIVRNVWYRAIGTPTVRQALVGTLAARHRTLRDTMAGFAVWNRSPARYYSEGRTYRTAPLDKGFVLTKAHPGSGVWTSKLYHLSSSTVRFDQGRTLPRSRKLRISVNLGNVANGAVARVVVRGTSGGLVTRILPLTSTGSGTLTVDFRKATVSTVELMMANGGTVTNGLPMSFSARAIR